MKSNLCTIRPCGCIIAVLVVAAALPLNTNAADRIVLGEQFTATWCGYCPPVRAAYGELLDNYPDAFAGMQIHAGDDYATSWGNSRKSFYGVTGYPTTVQDGILKRVGATAAPQIVPDFEARVGVATDVTIDLGAVETEPQTFQFTVTVGIEAGGTEKTMRIYVAQLLDHYPSGTDYRNCFMQAAAYQTVTIAAGGAQTLTFELPFTGVSWTHKEDIRVFAWAQGNGAFSSGSEVYQAAILSWPFNALVVTLPSGVPEFIPPDADTAVQVQITNASQAYVPGSGMLHYRYDDGEFLTSPLTGLGGELYEATLPAPGCGVVPEYYVSALGDMGTTVTNPKTAPDEVYTATVAMVASYITDDFNTDQGWVVEDGPDLTAGTWQRVIPSGDGSYDDPTTDFDGSGYCFVTGDGYHVDLDGGPTWLTSPTYDLSGTTAPILRCARWMACDDVGTSAEDYLVLEVSNDDGATWTVMDSVVELTGWVQSDFQIADFVTPTATMKFRFTVSDLPNNSKTEAGVDAFWLYELSCGPALCAGDMNCDGVVDYDDIDPFVAALSCVGGDPGCWDPACPWLNGDCNGDSAVTYADIDAFVGRIGATCD